MTDITVIYTSDKSVSVTFRQGWDESPSHLLDIEGIYDYSCKVTTSKSTTVDGSAYQESATEERDIVIITEIDGDYKKDRELLYRVFQKSRTGTLEYSEDRNIKTINCKVENVSSGAIIGVVRGHVTSPKRPGP